jgi:hypothetical protein
MSPSVAGSTDADLARIDKKVELATTEHCHPLVPVHARTACSLVDGPRREATGSEGEASTARPLSGVHGAPRRRKVASEGGGKVLLQISEAHGRDESDQWPDEESDGLLDRKVE